MAEKFIGLDIQCTEELGDVKRKKILILWPKSTIIHDSSEGKTEVSWAAMYKRQT